ncbi:MAG: hypothetical protein KJ638_10605, partial [Chloroflexi bacterium]|nr:hypothetical protein [Chloroflexota bacterium]
MNQTWLCQGRTRRDSQSLVLVKQRSEQKRQAGYYFDMWLIQAKWGSQNQQKKKNHPKIHTPSHCDKITQFIFKLRIKIGNCLLLHRLTIASEIFCPQLTPVPKKNFWRRLSGNRIPHPLRHST